MIRPATKHALELLGGGVAVVALGAGILAFKLASGPVSFKFMAPTFAAMLKNELGGDYGFEVGDVVLRWSRQAHSLGLELKRVNLYDRAGHLVAGVPTLEAGISIEGLRHGLIAPTRISLERASITVERDSTGAFSIGGAKEQPGRASVLPMVLDQIFATGGKRTAASYFSALSVKDADFTLVDRRTGITVRAPGAMLLLERNDKGFTGRLEATAAVGDQRAHVKLSGGFNAKTQSGAIDASFTPVRLSRVAKLSSFYAPFAPVDIPIGGTAHLDLGAKATVTRADLHLSGRGGALVPNGNAAQAIAVQSVGFKGTYWPQTGAIAIDSLSVAAGHNHGEITGHVRLHSARETPMRITGANVSLGARNVSFAWPNLFEEPLVLDRAEVEGDVALGSTWIASIKSAKAAFGQTRIEVAGEVAQAPGSPAMRISGNVTNFPAAQIGRYWPQSVAQNARRWVVHHVHAGRLTKGVLAINAPPGAFAAQTVDEAILKFDFRLEDGSISYIMKQPPLTGIAADMTLTPGTFTGKVERARLLETNIEGGRVFIGRLGVKDTPVEIEADASGRVEQILDIIDREPLHLITPYGLKPSDVSGDAKVHLALSVPQESDDEDKLGFAVSASTQHVKLAKIAGRVSAEEGAIDLKIDNNGLDGRGTLNVNGAPARIAWRERFRDKSGSPSEVKIHAVLDDGARAGLGIDAGSGLAGPVTVDLTARGKGLNVKALTAQLDLTRTRIDFAGFGWKKTAGTAARANLDVAIGANGEIVAKDIRAQGQGLDIAGQARLASNGKLLAARFPRLRIDSLVDASLVTDRRPGDGALLVKVDGRYLDLGPLLKDATGSGSERKLKLPWRVEASLERATLRGKVPVHGLRATVAATGSRLTALDASGRFDAGEEFSAAMTDAAAPSRSVTVHSSDAGSLIKGVTGLDSIVGGKLTLNARVAAKGAAVSEGRGTEGALRVEDFKVVDAPLLARLLTIGSLQGLSDLLNGQGIEFKRLQAPFWIENGSIGIEDARASGPAIGITLQGVIDRNKEKTDLNGTIVPAFTLNSALGNLPVVGELLVSRKGEGIFGFTYTVAGQMHDPQLMVNPLSALAPGFLRRLFEMGETQAGDARAPGAGTAAASQ